MRALFFLLPLLILVSCSGGMQKKAGIRLEVSNQGLFASGGMIVFGTSGSNKFTRSITSTSPSHTLNLEIPRGTWSIGAIAWDGGAPFQGTVRCDLQTATFESDTAALQLTVDNLKCFNSGISAEVGQGTSPKTALPIFPQFCEGDVSGLTTENCIHDPTYDYVTGPNKKRGFIGSYKFKIQAGEDFDGTSTPYLAETLESPCFIADNSIRPVTDLNIPAFNAGVGVPLKLRAYLDGSCDGDKGVIVLSFDNSARLKFSIDVSEKYSYARVSIAEVCAKGAANTPVASGNGTSDFPWVICTAQQLKAVQKLTGQDTPVGDAERAGFFVLGADINLFPFIYLGTSTDLTRFDPCSTPGDTWIPMGKRFNGCSSLISQSPMTMNFDGNNFTLSHVRHDGGSSSHSGFIGNTSGSITNLKIKGASIRGGNFTGTVAGVAGSLRNISLNDVQVEGDDDTGGAAGNVPGVVLNVHVVRGDIEGQNSTGGIVGTAGGLITTASFNGWIYAESSVSEIGGIVGSGMAVTNAVSTGIIRTGGDKVGGISGTGLTISASRSDMFIKDHSQMSGRYFGGLGGNIGTSVTESYFHGRIDSSCTTCNLGAITGNAVTLTLASATQTLGLGTGSDGNAETFTNIRTNTYFAAICANYSPVTDCPWKFVTASGDFPRLSFEITHPCKQAINNASFAAQLASQSDRGSLTNPYRICNESQLTDANLGLTGKFYVLEQNVNALGITALPTIIFNGTLNGKGNMIHSLVATGGEEDDTGGNALFLSNDGTVKNLRLAGFSMAGNDCSGCQKGTLALVNNGTIDKVEVSDFVIDMNDETPGFVAGGLVAINSFGATISNSIIEGDLRTFQNSGGVVGENHGIISNVTSRSYVEIKPTPTLTPIYFGGVAAQNDGVISRTSFGGEIVDGDGTSMKIGGIVGYHTSPGTLTNVHVNSESLIKTTGSSTYVGGLIGYSSAAATSVRKSIYQGLLYEPTASSTINEIVGDSSPALTFTDTFSFVKTYQLYRSPASLSATYNAPNCEVTIGGASIDDNTTNHGALYFSRQAYFGTISYLGTYTYKVNVPAADCSDFTGMADFYATASGIPSVLSAATLKTYTYDILDLTVTADANSLFAVYGAWIKSILDPTVSVPTPPAWVYEPDEHEGLRIFKFH